MKIKILAVLAVVTVIVVSMFMREKREDPSSLVMMNVEALATGEGTSPAICVGPSHCAARKLSSTSFGGAQDVAPGCGVTLTPAGDEWA